MPELLPAPASTASTWGVLFLMTALSGLFLHRRGSPPQSLPLTLHKLSALAAGVLLGIAAWQRMPGAVSVYTGAVIFLAALVSGGLASAGAQPSLRARRLHRVLAWLTLLAAALFTYALTV